MIQHNVLHVMMVIILIMEYAKNVSFGLDLKILWKTGETILKRVESNYGSEVREALNVERDRRQ